MALALAAPPAWTQEGNGPYDPFPTPAAPSATPKYFAELNLHFDATDLHRGRFVGDLRPGPAQPASARAGLDGGDDDGAVMLIAGLAVGAIAGGAAVAMGRSRRTARPS